MKSDKIQKNVFAYFTKETMKNKQMLFSQLDKLYNQHWFFFGLMLKIIFCSLNYLNTEYNNRLGWACVHSLPLADSSWCLCWLRQFRGMDWIIFLSTTSIYTEFTLDCSDANHGRTDQIQLPCWWTQPISHSWLTGVPAFFCFFFPPLLNTLEFMRHLPFCSHIYVR